MGRRMLGCEAWHKKVASGHPAATLTPWELLHSHFLFQQSSQVHLTMGKLRTLTMGSLNQIMDTAVEH